MTTTWIAINIALAAVLAIVVAGPAVLIPYLLDRETLRLAKPARSAARVSVWVDPETQLAAAA